MNLPSLDSLACFEAAARLLHFRGAARAVALTPAALGQRIKQLEGELGVRLFHRTSRTVRLTDAGLQLLPVARRCLAEAEACRHAARGEAGPAPLTLTLGTRFELGLSWVVPQLEHLRERLPHLSVHLYFGSGPDLLARLRALQLEVAVTSSRLSDATLAAEPLHDESYALVGAPSLLRKTPLRRPEDAARHVLLDVDGELPLFRYLREAPGFDERTRFARIWHVGTGAAIKALALDGQGVAVLPVYLVREELRRKRLVRLLPQVEPRADRFRLVFRADDPRRSAYASLAAAMRETPLS